MTSKGQITIPAEVRERLQIETGDVLAYELVKGGVQLRKVQPVDTQWNAAISQTLVEWNSPEDEDAFRDLQ